MLLCHGRLSDLSDNVLSGTISLDEAYQTACERKDAAEARPVASALGAAAAMIRIALKQSDFYDFYASTVVDPDRLPDDLAQYARGFKRVLALQMAKDLLVILKRAVIREARHVSNSEAIDYEY